MILEERVKNICFIDGEEVNELILRERERQKETLNLIASENYYSKAIAYALASEFGFKYSEGYPGRRYYQGNVFADEVERIAIERAKKVFGAEHVNVQPHSGSSANFVAYSALLQKHDTILAMDLNQGGHLTHGSPVNKSGKLYNFVHYGVNEEGIIDLNEVEMIARKSRPRLIVCGATAYPRKIDFERFHKIAKDVGAYSMADISHIAGLIAGEVHENPIPYFDVVTSTTHKTLRGPKGAIIMCKEEHANSVDKAIFPGSQGGPHMNTIAGKAICFKEAMEPQFKQYVNQVVMNANCLAESMKERGIKLSSNGTDNHLILIDLEKTLNEKQMGKEIAGVLEESGIIVNMNSIPNSQEKQTPSRPSGIRLGTPAITTRGMKEEEMKLIGGWIADIIYNPKDELLKSRIRKEVEILARGFGLFQD